MSKSFVCYKHLKLIKELWKPRGAKEIDAIIKLIMVDQIAVGYVMFVYYMSDSKVVI